MRAKPATDAVARLEAIAAGLRQDIVDVLTYIGHDHRGHPGASLSIVDIITALYFEVLRIDPARPDWPERDRFVLSKGHGCLALYAALARRGFFAPDHLRTYRTIDSILQGHPDMRRTPGIDMTSGSLGHGLSAAVGLALDARARPLPAHTDVLLGDGELQEGLVWEGAMAAAKYGLSRLTAYVDCNGLQSSGRVSQIMPIEPLAAKWRAFGWRVLAVDGHDMAAIVAATRSARRGRRRPTVILARTIKGKGVGYMEDDNAWHQRSPAPQISEIDPAVHGTHPRNHGVNLRTPAIDLAVHEIHPQITQITQINQINPGESVDAARTDTPSRLVAEVASTRAAFGDTVLQLAREGLDLFVVTSDTCSSMGLERFAAEHPDRHIEVGIAEQNLMTVAAGLAAGGRTVFVATYAAFASLRALEQVRTFIAYPRLRVVIAAGLGGLSAGIEGAAHLAMEDIGILRCVPGLTILNPSDAASAAALVRAAADVTGPVYIRLGRDDSPVVHRGRAAVSIGRGVILADHGRDVALMSSGLVTAEVLAAAAWLGADGIGCTVIEFATLKPIDRDLVSWAAAQASALVTVEEHSVIGGLGTAVMEVLAETTPAIVHRIGIHDAFLESGSPQQLRAKFGLTAEAIAGRVRSIVDRQRRERRKE